MSENGEDVFHYRSIEPDTEGFKALRGGQPVEFIQVRSEKGWQAAEVSALEAESTAED